MNQTTSRAAKPETSTRMSTDLDRHVEAEGRSDLVKQVRQMIDELGIKYIYNQFISVTGRIVGKGIPADHWERSAERGLQLVYGATANLFIDRHGHYIGYGPEASELVFIPDPETFCQLPWDKRVARVFCTCFRNREERDNPGRHLTSDCRGNLRLWRISTAKGIPRPPVELRR
jgi:glutamine synthetase